MEFINERVKVLNDFANKYENSLIIGDLNMDIETLHSNKLLQLCNLNTLISTPTCCQSMYVLDFTSTGLILL